MESKEIKITKDEWVRRADNFIASKLSEARRLVGKAMLDPNLSITRLASIALSESSRTMMMRGGAHEMAEGDYVFMVDKYGVLDLAHIPSYNTAAADKFGRQGLNEGGKNDSKD
jgi:hypothetical protein